MANKPTVEVVFKQLATSLINRSERGIAILIVKDTTDTTTEVYSNSTEIDDSKFTSENVRYIKDVLEFSPKKLIVIRMGENEESTLGSALSKLQWFSNTGWITIADGTDEEYTDLVSWIKAKENEGYTYKAIVYNVNTCDCRHIVNFATDTVTFADDRGEEVGVAYLPSLLGILANCNVTRGTTSYVCSNLTGCTNTNIEDIDEMISDGKLVLVGDVDEVKILVGINSLTTTNGLTLTEDMQYIDIVEVMDLITDDIKNVFKDTYQGKYKNNYDNQMLFISAINTYFDSLADEYILDNNYNNKADIDVEAQKSAWAGTGKDTSEWDEATARKNSFKRTVFLNGDIKILGAMESLKFEVSLF